MPVRRHLNNALVLFSILLFARVGFAELPSIRFDRISPLGASAGTTVEVEIAGSDIEEVRALSFDHAGITAVPVEGKERFFSVTMAANVPQGTYDVRLVGRWGISNPRLFAVAHGFQDIIEIEPNNDSAHAQVLPLNSALAGMSDGNGQDIFRFAAKTGQRIVIDCQAGVLDSMLDATMSLSAISKAPSEGTPSDRQLLVSSSDYHGRDPFIDITCPVDGDYEILVHDLSYRGGLPYRLLVTDHPYVENVFPRAVQAGQKAELTALGRNLGPQATPSLRRINDQPLQEYRFTIDVPTDILSSGAYRFAEHPSGHSVLPTAATCTINGIQVQPVVNTNSPAGNVDVVSLNAQTLLVAETPVSVEIEPNDESTAAQAISIPTIISGRFDQPRDADWFEIEVAQSGQYAFDVYCERINGNADPYLVVIDDQGNRVTELDDFGHRINAFDGHLRDPSGMVSLNEKRKYRVLVQDRYQRGGARYQYVLSIRKPRPDFFPAVIHSQNPGPGGTNLWRGGTVYLDAVIHQQDGYNGEITFTAVDLPPGVHSVPTVINNNSRGVFVLWADDNAADFTGPIKIVANGKRDDEVLHREVRVYTRVDSGTNSSQATRNLLLAVRDSAPYRLEWEQAQVEAEAGQSVALKLRLTRRVPDWKNEVTIQPLAFPGNFQMPNSSITGDQQDLAVTITVQKGTRPGAYTLAVLGQSQVPFNKDPAAKDRPNTLVSLASQPITIIIKPEQTAK